MKKIWLATVSLFFAFAFFNLTFADTPTVVSFISPQSLESGQVANLGWTINGGGHSLILFCSQGIKLRYATTNLPFPCDTRVSVSPRASDGVSLIVANISGSPRIVTVRIIPKDANGAVDYEPGAIESRIYVNPSRQPFSIFYTNATTTVSGVPTTLYWSSLYLDGVNIRIVCDESITATSTKFGKNNVPCGQMIFPTDLPGSGSVTFKFENQSPVDLPLDVTLFPAMSPSVYNGANAKTITLTVASDAQKPISLRFNASRTNIFSGDSVLFDWSVVNGTGANIKFACSPSLLMQTFTSATTTALSCGDYAWKTLLSPFGSTSVTFINPNQYDETATATIFPALKNGTYDGTKSEGIKINVAPLPKASALPTVPPPRNTAGAVQTQTQNPIGAALTPPAALKPAFSPPVITGKNVFKKWLSLGFRSEDVKLLQKFLAKDKSFYPEGYVTGYFGPITKKAVARFQLKYGLVKDSKDPAYGALDVKTRFLLNSLQ